ncbi:MAG: SIMPL domain-containing protein [Chloroflexota bacterium]|nr:SIMPL domain-containing protein [Chloroflexota bacterium]
MKLNPLHAALHATSGRLLALFALLALAAALLIAGALRVSADEEYDLKLVPSSSKQSTTLTIDGAASRTVAYDGAVARFRVVVERDSALEARQAGALVVSALRDAVDENCTTGEPDNADHTADPTCISPNGLQTVNFRLGQVWDWTEEGRVLRGWEYEYRLQIAIRGTGFAGGLVDLVIGAGGDSLQFDGLDFTASRRAEVERMALLDAIDDAQATADSIAEHMGYEIVRVVELSPVGNLTASRTTLESAEAAVADDSFEPTPVFGGSESVTSRVRMVFELRPMPGAETTNAPDGS